MTAAFLFCADPLRPRGADPHFEPQARAVRELGGRLALIDHDALVAGRVAEAVARVPEGLAGAWYRGWMLTPEQYRALDEALRERGCLLLTSPYDYRRAHETPGWLQAFWQVTAPTFVVPMAPGEAPPDGERLARLTAGLRPGGFVVKDYVKSRKHEWLEACYAPDAAALERVVATFVERQGADLAGGLTIRRFEDLGDGQLRVWWLDGRPVFTGPHPDEPDRPLDPPRDLTAVRAAVAGLGARFVTTDLARRHDGAWRVVEVGDGQVSDWPASAGPSVLVSALMAARYGFRLTKYDPALRDAVGAFRGDDWTAMSDIGRTFGGVELTRERYEEVEAAYLTAITLLARANGLAGVDVEPIRAALRQEAWFHLDASPRFSVEVGYDFYVHITSAEPGTEVLAEIERLGLFLEPESPYRP